ncbi:MAG TPA: tetratricopeptide repeat protein [Solirubrobacteraceae bacterium]|nr:tetratricopeptide repeat protein [Solirubrobacteraceae bacterium]
MTRDEEAFLRRCLDPVRGAVGHVLVADTGSTDATPRIAAELADEVVEVAFEEDFGRARNAVLDHVRTPWALFLDADEIFERGEAPELVRFAADAAPDVLGVRVLRYDLLPTGGWFSGRRLKLLRVDRGVRYRGRINEDVTASVREAGGRVADAPVILNHYGQCRGMPVRHAKSRRYLEILREELLEDPSDGIRVAYVAMHLRNLGRFDEALREAARAVELRPDSPKVRVFHGHVLRSAGRVAEARVAYREALAAGDGEPGYWSRGAIHNLLGVMDALLGDVDAAERELRTAFEADPLAVHALINQGVLAEARGDHAAAAALYRRAAERNPAFLGVNASPLLEYDPVLPTLHETVSHFAGLGRHLAFCERRMSGE